MGRLEVRIIFSTLNLLSAAAVHNQVVLPDLYQIQHLSRNYSLREEMYPLHNQTM